MPQALVANLISISCANHCSRASHDPGNDNRLYAVVIRAAQKAGDWREAVLLYREAEAANLAPSAATATTVFLACYADKRVREEPLCLWLLCRMLRQRQAENSPFQGEARIWLKLATGPVGL